MFESIFSKPLSEIDKALTVKLLLLYREHIHNHRPRPNEPAPDYRWTVLANYLFHAGGDVKTALAATGTELADYINSSHDWYNSITDLLIVIGYLKLLYPAPNVQ